MWVLGGAKALGEMIAVNNKVENLNLANDDSLGEGVESLLASLGSNITLVKLFLSEMYHKQADSRVLWKKY